MSIVIKEINNEQWLHSIGDIPINFTPYTNSNRGTFSVSIRIGKIKYSNLIVDEIYDLDYDKDFMIIERIKQVKHEDGLIYDDLIFINKSQYLKYTRKQKLKQIQ